MQLVCVNGECMSYIIIIPFKISRPNQFPIGNLGNFEYTISDSSILTQALLSLMVYSKLLRFVKYQNWVCSQLVEDLRNSVSSIIDSDNFCRFKTYTKTETFILWSHYLNGLHCVESTDIDSNHFYSPIGTLKLSVDFQ